MNKDMAKFLFTGLNARDNFIYNLTDEISESLNDEIMQFLTDYVDLDVVCTEKQLDKISDNLNDFILSAIDKAVTITIDETCNILGLGKPFKDSAKIYGNNIYKVNYPEYKN